jgi:hypothetical protein
MCLPKSAAATGRPLEYWDFAFLSWNPIVECEFTDFIYPLKSFSLALTPSLFPSKAKSYQTP